MTSREYIYTMAKQAQAQQGVAARLGKVIAAIKGRVGAAGRRAVGGVKRYGQLLRGGRDYATLPDTVPPELAGAFRVALLAGEKQKARAAQILTGLGLAGGGTAGGLVLGSKRRKAATVEKAAQAKYPIKTVLRTYLRNMAGGRGARLRGAVVSRTQAD